MGVVLLGKVRGWKKGVSRGESPKRDLGEGKGQWARLRKQTNKRSSFFFIGIGEKISCAGERGIHRGGRGERSTVSCINRRKRGDLHSSIERDGRK